MCGIASRKGDDSRVTCHKFRIRFLFLRDGLSNRNSVALWLAQQHPTVKDPVQAPGGYIPRNL